MNTMVWMAGAVAALVAAIIPGPVRTADLNPPRVAKPAVSTASAPPFMDGVIEGFYGPDWSTANTEAIFAFMQQQHLNTFVYAPKYDPYQRADWSKPYPPKNLAALARLVASARQHGITFIDSVSPGLSINYGSMADRQLLAAKMNQVRKLGVSQFMLSFDDIGGTPTAALAQEQAALANWIVRTETPGDPAFHLILTPTLYDGVSPNPYWAALKTRLDASVGVVWTGPYVLSKTITFQDAKTVQGLIGHPLVIWDNYPVNDYTYVQPPHHPQLFLGPVMGRSPGLKKIVAGYFFNPMLQAQASEVALWTGADYLNHPYRYQPAVSFEEAVAALGGTAKASLLLFAEAASSSALGPSRTPLAGEIAGFWANRPPQPGASALMRTFRAMANANQSLKTGLPDTAFYAQIAPWSRLFSEEGQAGVEAIQLLAATANGRPVTRAAINRVKMLDAAISQSSFTLDTTRPVERFINTVLSRVSAKR